MNSGRAWEWPSPKAPAERGRGHKLVQRRQSGTLSVNSVLERNLLQLKNQ